MRTAKAGHYPTTILSNLNCSTTVLTHEKRNYQFEHVCMEVWSPFRVKIRTIKQLKSHSTKLPVPCVVWPFQHHLAHSFSLSFCSSTISVQNKWFRNYFDPHGIFEICFFFLFIHSRCRWSSLSFAMHTFTHGVVRSVALLTTQTSRFSFISAFFVFRWLSIQWILISYYI